MGKTLTDRQRRFIEEYIIDQNAEAAARRAGYANKTARAKGHILRHHPVIAKQIHQRLNNLTQEAGIKAQDVIQEVVAIAFANYADIVEFDENGVRLKPSDQIPTVTLKAITSINSNATKFGVNTSVKMDGKLKALELLGRNLGLFKEKEINDAFENLTDDQLADEIAKRTNGATPAFDGKGT